MMKSVSPRLKNLSPIFTGEN